MQKFNQDSVKYLIKILMQRIDQPEEALIKELLLGIDHDLKNTDSTIENYAYIESIFLQAKNILEEI